MSAPDRLEARTPTPWTRIVLLGVFAALFLCLALYLASHDGPGTGLFSFLSGVLALVLAWLAVASARPVRMVLTRFGIEWGGPVPGEFSWQEVEGVGAIRVLLPGVEPFLRYHVYLRDHTDLIATSRWVGLEALLGSLQAGRFDPTAVFDEAMALRDPPRGDPAVAVGADPSAVERFALAAAKGFAEAEVTAAISRRRLRATTDDGVFELFALALIVMREPESKWVGLVRDHVRSVVAVRRAAREVIASALSLDDVRDRLRVQLMPARHTTAHEVGHSLAGTELCEVVVVTVDGGEATLGREALARWGATDEQAFAIARANLAAEPPLRRVPLAGSPLELLTGPYAAARAVALDAWIDLDPRYGGVVAFPSQDDALVFAFGHAADLIQFTMSPLANTFDRVRAVSPRPLGGVFWWFRGRLVPVPRIQTIRGIEWVIPDELSGRLLGRITD